MCGLWRVCSASTQIAAHCRESIRCAAGAPIALAQRSQRTTAAQLHQKRFLVVAKDSGAMAEVVEDEVELPEVCGPRRLEAQGANGRRSRVLGRSLGLPGKDGSLGGAGRASAGLA